MQTFLPYPLFAMSAEVLDNKRLNKQKVEAMQIYKIITGQAKYKAWKNHPAVNMWRGFEDALAFYYNCIRHECIKRGFKNTMPELPVKIENYGLKCPPWLGKEKFHSSHRASLKRKSPSFYGKYNWSESPNISYVWPTKKKLL